MDKSSGYSGLAAPTTGSPAAPHGDCLLRQRPARGVAAHRAVLATDPWPAGGPTWTVVDGVLIDTAATNNPPTQIPYDNPRCAPRHRLLPGSLGGERKPDKSPRGWLRSQDVKMKADQK
jgi:hypothetical protein